MIKSLLVWWWMLRTFLLLFVVFTTALWSANTEKSKIEITANHLESTKNSVHAKGSVLVYYQDSIIKASSANFNKTTKLLILDGNIEMISHEGTKEHATHIEINTINNSVHFEELLLVSDNDIWLISKNVVKKEGNYSLGASILSSCDIENPLWQMAFESSKYDSQNHYMQLYDAKVYLGDVPVLYTPYLAFTTHQERSSGLLFPSFGYSSEDGLLYEQPIFWAISPAMDIEFNPQLRTSRSLGIYNTLRFVDSNHSKGFLRLGYFRDFDSYIEQNNLSSNEHYGVEFNYASSDIFDFEDGLYINSTFLNDIDYLNLQKDRLKHFGLVPLQESRLNYFTQNENYYMGVNAKYFIDTRKENNDDTFQILPSFQAHRYLNHLIWKNLTYSTDFTLNNFDRKEGTTMRQASFKVPIEVNTALFDDFVNLSWGEELYYSKFFFGNGEYKHNTFEYYSNIHKVRLFSDLTKKYEDFIHVLQPSLSYLKPGSETQSPVRFTTLTEEQKELFTVGLPEEQYSLGLSQYFYDMSMNLKFYQRLSFAYYVQREDTIADVSNEMEYRMGKWRFYNALTYAHTFGTLREASSTVSLYKEKYYFSLGHSYKQVLEDAPTDISANDINIVFGYNIDKRFKITGALSYDLDNDSSKQWRFGGNYSRDCWSMDISMRQSITPRPTGVTTDTTFYLQLNFKPFVSLGSG